MHHFDIRLKFRVACCFNRFDWSICRHNVMWMRRPPPLYKNNSHKIPLFTAFLLILKVTFLLWALDCIQSNAQRRILHSYYEVLVLFEWGGFCNCIMRYWSYLNIWIFEYYEVLVVFEYLNIWILWVIGLIWIFEYLNIMRYWSYLNANLLVV